jgi:DNA-binding transcriptional MerR regulator/quercetin dioxygenase-like cupin family protein
VSVNRHVSSSPSSASERRRGGGLRIGEAARRLNVSPSVLRLWERQGLVRPARSRSGYRLYSEADIELLERVHRMRSVEKVNAPGIRRIIAPRAAEAHGDMGRGARLRALRQQAALSLRAAAERTGLSMGFISAVERGASGASVATLKRLTEAYGVTLQELFEQAPAKRLVRPPEHPVLELAEGSVRIEQLAHAGSRLESHLFVLGPGASSQGAYSHPGEELIFVLEGEVRVWLGDEEVYDLAGGDALSFSSELPHSWQNKAANETRLLWINTPPTF